MAVCRRSIPCRPFVNSSGVRSMIIAVQVQITRVSMNTPRACRSPSFAGWLISAAAAAQGADPDPASLEKSPLFTPFIKTAPNPPAATWRIPNASSKILANTAGSCGIFMTMIKIVIIKYKAAITGTMISSTFTVAFFRRTITAAKTTSTTVE